MFTWLFEQAAKEDNFYAQDKSLLSKVSKWLLFFLYAGRAKEHIQWGGAMSENSRLRRQCARWEAYVDRLLQVNARNEKITADMERDTFTGYSDKEWAAIEKHRLEEERVYGSDHYEVQPTGSPFLGMSDLEFTTGKVV